MPILMIIVHLLSVNFWLLKLLYLGSINMCENKITIKNPLFGSGQYGLNFLKDTTSHYIQVPCGRCSQCASMRQSFYLQRIQMESLRSHLFFFTLTYNNESLVYTDVGDYQIPYPHLPDIQNMFKRLRRKGYNFRVTYVSEYGSRLHRPHFHGILAVDKSLGDFRTIERMYYKLFWNEWKRNYADIKTPRVPLYKPLFTPIYELGRCKTFDFHYIEPVMDHDNDVAFYVSKYITKYDSWIYKLMQKISLDPNLSDDETSFLLNRLKPRCNTSKDFGDKNYPLIKSYISSCASRVSQFKFPQYYDIITKKQMPMSPYYGKNLPEFAHLYKLFEMSPLFDENSTVVDDDKTRLDVRQFRNSSILREDEYVKKLKKLEKNLQM